MRKISPILQRDLEHRTLVRRVLEVCFLAVRQAIPLVMEDPCSHLSRSTYKYMLELAANMLQLHLRAPLMLALAHTLDGIDSTSALGWINHRSITNNDTVAILFMWQNEMLGAAHTVSSCLYLEGRFNKMADAALRLAHLSPATLINCFNNTFPPK